MIDKRLLSIIITILFIVPVSKACAFISADQEALAFYSDGSYRHSLEDLQKKADLSPVEKYLLARDFQELNNLPEALEAFSKIAPEAFRLDKDASKDSAFFIDNYCFYYSEALFDGIFHGKINVTNADSIMAGLMKILPASSLYRSDVDAVYLALLWKEKRYDVLTRWKGTNSLSSLYRSAAKFLSGDHSGFSDILNAPSGFAFNQVFPEISKLIQPGDLYSLTPAQLSRAFLETVHSCRFDLAKAYLKAHFALTRDSEFAVRNGAVLDYRNGKRKEALAALSEYLGSGKTSQKAAELYLDYLYYSRDYHTAYSAAVNQVSIYPNLADEYIRILDKLGRYEELASYYLKKRNDQAFRQNYEEAIFRLILQERPEIAKRLLAGVPDSDKSPYLNYVAGLWDLDSGKPESAYRKLLSVTLSAPFTYEWVICRNYEAQLRTNFSGVYNEALSNKLSHLDSMGVKEKLLFTLAMEDVDGAVYSNQLNTKAFQGILEDFRERSVREKLPQIPPRIFLETSVFLNNASPVLFGFNQEMALYLDKKLADSSNRIAAVYLFMEQYRKMGEQGLTASRMNNLYSPNQLNRQNTLLLEDRVLSALYPAADLDLILESETNTNRALWILSAFREESRFVKNAASYVGAIGYSQLMPATASVLKRNMGKLEYTPYDFRDNIAMGVFHYRYLFRKFKENPAHALSAYNAGESAIRRWMRKHPYQNELWTECVEYPETRDYVKKITLTKYFYERLLREK